SLLPFINSSNEASGETTFCGFGGFLASFALTVPANASPVAAAPKNPSKRRRESCARSTRVSLRHIMHTEGLHFLSSIRAFRLHPTGAATGRRSVMYLAKY